MPLLFSYGTLQLEEVQLATFGRRLAGGKDAIVGFEPSLVRIPDPDIVERLKKTHHDNVVQSATDSSRVQGTAFDVTDAELAQADVYEAEFDYVRVLAPLASGKEAWVYVHHAPTAGTKAPSAPRHHMIADLFDIELPVIQAPMAGSQGSALAIAVSNAGGLGSQPCAMLGPDGIRNELAAITAATSKPYNVNFFVHEQPTPSPIRERAWRKTLMPYFAELGIDPDSIAEGPQRLPFNHDAADVLEAFRPPVVSFHFGLPSGELMARVKSWGSKVLSTATTVDEAKYLEAHGVDVVIAQGYEAGGHRGMFLTDDLSTQAGTFALVQQIAHAVKVPVVAAGGIADANGVAAALALGAAGVQVGTAYLFCPEATTNPLHRAMLGSEAARNTAVTNLFTGRPARGIVNRLIREIGPMNHTVPAFPLAATAIFALRSRAEADGIHDFTSMWAGQNAAGCKGMPAAELTRSLMAR